MPLLPLRIGPTDASGHEAFHRFVARVFPRADFRAWIGRGGWTADYAAHALVDGDTIVSNACVMRHRVVVDGRERRAAQLGAVGTLPEWRGQGLARRVLEPLLAELEREVDLVFLYANPGVIDFYPRFGFRRAQEASFEREVVVTPSGDPAPRLDLDDPLQRERWLAAHARAPAADPRFGLRDFGAAALWHACNTFPRQVRILDEGEVYAVATQEGDTLLLHDLVATRAVELETLLPRLVEAPIVRVRFGFSPARHCPAARAVGPSEELLFVRGPLAPPAAPFGLPALAQT